MGRATAQIGNHDYASNLERNPSHLIVDILDESNQAVELFQSQNSPNMGSGSLIKHVRPHTQGG